MVLSRERERERGESIEIDQESIDVGSLNTLGSVGN